MALETERKSSLKDLVVTMAKAVVKDKAAVIIEEVEAPDTLVFHLIVAPNDVGRVIGKKGRVASAMRIILAAAAKGDRRVSLRIEPSPGQDLT